MQLPALTQDQLQALSAGAAFLAAYLLAAIGVWLAARGLRARPTPLAVGLRYWAHWPTLGRAISLVASVGYPYAMVLTAAFSAGDVGLTPVDWPAALPWVVTLGAGGALWVGLLWGAHRRRAGTDRARGPWLAVVVDVLSSEGTAAIARGTLTPLAGPYWGIWLAPVAKMLASRISPHLVARLGRAGQRESVYLGWALDWLAAVVFAFGGGVWGALAARLLGSVAAGVAARMATRRTPTPTARPAPPPHECASPLAREGRHPCGCRPSRAGSGARRPGLRR